MFSTPWEVYYTQANSARINNEYKDKGHMNAKLMAISLFGHC